MESILQKSQYEKFTKNIIYQGKSCIISAVLRYDDKCNNGHNTFSITGSIKGGEYRHYGYEINEGGCIHDQISRFFPEFKHLIKYHLMSSKGPLHYIANTIYWFNEGEIEFAKSSAIWGITPLDTNINLLADKLFLEKRLPYIMKAFKKDIEKLNFVF